MKGLFKRILLITVACACVFSLGSCFDMKEEETKAFIDDFFTLIVNENYDKAEEFLHPDHPADLKAFFLNVEESKGIDFQAGVEIEEYEQFRYWFYDSAVDGSAHELIINTIIGEEKVQFTISIVDNENGYGIVDLRIDIKFHL